jgi:hypothetical protein
MNAPRYLYHGTSAKVAERALREGLKPRSAEGVRSNWKRTIESNPETVYLTDAYPLYFALNCDSKAPAIIQLDVEKLNTLWLVPDEDVLEQAGRGQDGLQGTMKQRTRTYRKRLPGYVATDKWETSLQAMGTCGSMQPIPAEAIAQVAFIDAAKAPTLCFGASDAMICLQNYRFCGAKYRNLTNQIFGLPLEEDPLNAPFEIPADALPDDPQFEPIRQIVAQRQGYADELAKEIHNAVRFETTRQKEAA